VFWDSDRNNVMGVKGTLQNNDYLNISINPDLYKLGHLHEFLWGIADFKNAVLHYFKNKEQLESELDSIKHQIFQGFKSTKRAELHNFCTLNDIAAESNLDVHLVSLYLIRMYIQDPASVKFKQDGENNFVYIKITKSSNNKDN
jgi:hypothetical protein